MTTVLLVEDMVEILDPERMLIEGAGYTAIGATSAEEAITILECTHVDLVFSDIRLDQGQDGVWLAEQVNMRFPHVQVVLTTAYASAQEVAHNRWRTLMKPYTIDKVVQIIVEELDENR